MLHLSNYVSHYIFLGCKCLHPKLFSLHYVGSMFCFPGSLPGKGVRTLCLWFWNSRGEFLLDDVCLKTDG